MKKIVKSKAFLLFAVFAVGVVVGGFLGAKFYDNPSKTTTPWVNSQATSQAGKDPEDQLEDNYKQAQELVKKDLERKAITQEQADKINAKLTEAYEYAKNVDQTSQQAKEEFNDKKREWRQWARDNDVSTRYIILIR